MNLPQLAIALVEKFTPMPEDELNKLRYDIEADWKNIITDPEHDGYKKTVKTQIKEKTSGPWTRLIIAVSFIPLVRWIQDFMNPQYDQDDDVRQNPLKKVA
jgi:hypothetical protein